MTNGNKPAIIEELTLKEKLYHIRGQQVMLDFDLAEIYGYSTKAFNQQVKNNAAKFPVDFRFQLTRSEVEEISRSKNLTSIQTHGVKGGRVYLPYAFTEQGIYMLMSVLKGDLAVSQSIALIRLFKSMKDYLIENQPFLTNKNYYALADKVEKNSQRIEEIENSMVKRTDLSDIMKLFDSHLDNDEILILDGKPFKADEAYQKIYRSAKKSIIVIDDYIGIKTLRHIAHSKKNASVTIISDNAARPKLNLTEYNDFLTENPSKNIRFLQSLHRSHDRYIVIDEGTNAMKVYHCGASSKDAGNRITTITRIMHIDEYKAMVKAMLNNPVLMLN